MIKFKRLPSPIELTAEVVAQKTASFKSNPNSTVWKEPYINKRLMEMTNSKCAYCECKLNVESNFMEVEHFHDKNQYPDEVVCWENLLPSCKKCNGSKGTHDTLKYPIVNPSIDDPRYFLGYRNNMYMYKSKNSIGEETIVALHLNDLEKHCKSRYEVCSALLLKINECLETVKRFSNGASMSEINRLKCKVVEVLEACQCEREYTAIKATVVANDNDYAGLVYEMNRIGIWTEEMNQLDAKMRSYCLDVI